jgi:hypothetical protein
MIALDHLVLAAATLEAGRAYAEQLLGVPTQPGGKHARMGTHNRLLNLGDAYLEIIAIDPDGEPPFQPRWFALDDPEMRARLAAGPALIHWVASTDNIERDAARSSFPLGAIHAMERDDLRWRITIPPDGELPGNGLIPTLIQWDVDDHPSKRLPESGYRMVALRGAHPQPKTITAALSSLGLDQALAVEASRDRRARLEAVIETPNRRVTLA